MPTRRKGSKYLQINIGRVRRSSKTNDWGKAKALEDQLNAEAWDANNLGIKFGKWDAACLSLIKSFRGLRPRSLAIYAEHAKFWQQHLSGKPLRSITHELVESVLNGNPHDAVPSNTTANLRMAFVGRVMRHAGLNWKPNYYPAPKGREEWLTVDQWESLCGVMSDELRQVSAFSLCTGLREANVIGCQWSWVRDTSLLIPSEFTKTVRPYALPLNKTALSVLEERRRSPVGSLRNVFLLGGREIYPSQLRRAWDAALRASKLPHFRYHDLRHTYASWMVQAGVPFEIVSRLGQWQVKGMVNRYSHFDVESLRPWAERFDTILAQSEKESQQNNAVG